MNEYTFSVSLRITHPTLTAEEVAERLNMRPDVARTVGSARISPAGKLLEGVWRETYVAFEWPLLAGDNLVDLLERELKVMSIRMEAMKELMCSGGKGSCYVLASPIGETFGEELPPHILLGLAELGLSLCLEIYQS